MKFIPPELLARKFIADEVMENMLNAHSRIAESGSASEVIRLSKYIMKLADRKWWPDENNKQI